LYPLGGKKTIEIKRETRYIGKPDQRERDILKNVEEKKV
jgi:hypothetical protein